MVKNTYGTGCFLLMFNTGERRSRRRQRAADHAVLRRATARPAYALEGSVFIAGAAVQWLRDELGIIKTAAETEALPQSVPDTAGVYVVPAFAGLGAPYWDADARGAMLGLTRGAGARPRGPGDARVDGLPDPRRGRRDDGRLGQSRCASCGSTAAPPRTTS